MVEGRYDALCLQPGIIVGLLFTGYLLLENIFPRSAIPTFTFFLHDSLFVCGLSVLLRAIERYAAA